MQTVSDSYGQVVKAHKENTRRMTFKLQLFFSPVRWILNQNMAINQWRVLAHSPAAQSVTVPRLKFNTKETERTNIHSESLIAFRRSISSPIQIRHLLQFLIYMRVKQKGSIVLFFW